MRLQTIDDPQLTPGTFVSANGTSRLDDVPMPGCRVIEASSGWRAVNFRELWRYRELMYFMIWRDIKVRYKQTVLGAAWALLQPLMTMIVFTIFFGRFGGMSKNVAGSYALFVYAGLLPWQFFSTAVTQSGLSLVNSANLISKAYFPRLIIPVSSIGSPLVDFAVSLGMMLLLMLYQGVVPGPGLLLVPLLLMATVLAAVGVGTLLAALVVAYRDFRHVIPFLVQIWMFASPIAYPLSVVPEKYRLVYSLNPLVGIVGGFRWALLGDSLPWECLAVSTSTTVVLFIAGLYYFRRVERRFADII